MVSAISNPMNRDRCPRPGQYGIVTAVYNGARSIAATADALARQSMPPAFWIVVDDGSSDGTVGILEEQRWGTLAIDVVRRTRDTSDPFISKARALNLGLALAREKSCEFVGVLDADIVAAPDYFEVLLRRMSADGRLGIAGGDVVPMVNGVRQYRRQKPDFSVAGAVQMFRRDCMNGLGWTCPEIVGGGEDAAMEIIARFQGWKIRTFEDLPVMHDGPVGGRGWRRLRYLFMTGISFRRLGYHPFFAMARAAGRVCDRPPVLGAATEFMGYLWGLLAVRTVCLDPHVVAYLHSEQKARIQAFLQRLNPLNRRKRRATNR